MMEYRYIAMFFVFILLRSLVITFSSFQVITLLCCYVVTLLYRYIIVAVQPIVLFSPSQP